MRPHFAEPLRAAHPESRFGCMGITSGGSLSFNKNVRVLFWRTLKRTISAYVIVHQTRCDNAESTITLVLLTPIQPTRKRCQIAWRRLSAAPEQVVIALGKIRMYDGKRTNIRLESKGVFCSEQRVARAAAFLLFARYGSVT